MSDTVYAAALGLVIPVLGVSVFSKLWKHGRAALRGQKIREPEDGLGLGFVVRLSLLLAACFAFHRVASSMKMEPEHFDPYHILELPSRAANSSVIRSHYRRLSLKHHPDKNPGNRHAANVQFNKVAKAYKALSDPEARRNWEKYGHPDGYQPWIFDLALPTWLRPSKDTDKGTMVLYAVGYIAVLIGFVLSAKMGLDMLDPAGAPKKPRFEVTQEDVQALLNNLDDSSSTEDILECLAACPQLCSEERRALAEDMAPTTTPIRVRLAARGAALLLRSSATPPNAPEKNARSSGGKGKGKGKGGGNGKNGGGGSGNKGASSEIAEEASGGGGGAAAVEQAKEAEQEFFSKGRRGEGNRKTTRSLPKLSQVVMHNLVVLLSALYREDVVVAADTAPAPAATGEGDEASQNGEVDDPSANIITTAAADAAGVAEASRALADEQEALFGLAEPLLDACLKVAARRASPQLFGTVVEAKAILRRRLWSSEDPEALSEQAREADVDLDAAVPRVKIDSVKVETWGESQVALGDTVTATITIIREHACEYRGFRRRRPVAGFLSRGEPWWVIIATGRDREALIAVTPMLVENLGNGVAECKVKFQAPRRPCMMPLTVALKSPVFVGVDCEENAAFRVYRHDELKEDDGDPGDW